MNIIPYVKNEEGVWSIPLETIKGIYFKIHAEGKADAVFMDGSIKSEDQFIEYMQSGRTVMYLILSKSGSLIGVIHLNRFEGKSARVHFCMFDSADTVTKIQAAKNFIGFFFDLKNADGSNMFEAMIGATPVSNKPASSMAKHLGFIDIGIQPSSAFNAKTGESEDIILRYLKADMHRR